MAKITKMLVGESLVGDGNEVAHIDLIIGPRGTPAETSFANALTNNKDGFTALLAVVAPNLMTKPATCMFNKVTIKGAKQAVQMFGPAQHGVAKAVMDCVAEGTIPEAEADKAATLKDKQTRFRHFPGLGPAIICLNETCFSTFKAASCSAYCAPL